MCGSVFGAVSKDVMIVMVCMSVFVEEVLYFGVSISGFWFVDKEGDMGYRGFPPGEGFRDWIWFKEGKDEDSGMCGEALS